VVPADMSLLAGRRFEIHVTDTGIRLKFTAEQTRFRRDASSQEPDLRLSATLANFTRMMLRE
jgi:O2-independent ubiquinone biosynthesis accessory factor UbiT